MTHRLGWTLIHFLWQGALIAALYAPLRAGMRRASPRARYTLACAALIAMLSAALVTLVLNRQPRLLPPPAHVHPAAMSVYGSSLYGNTMNPEATERGPRWLSWVVGLWLAGAVAFSLRLLIAWTTGMRLRVKSVRSAPAEWQQSLNRLCLRTGLSCAVQLLVSALVEVPVVIGQLRPVILVPVGMLSGLPPDHVEALLLHELAHIRRRDYLINILQSIVEALLFYHPAVWWISGHIRAEREHCCDDLAAAAAGDVHTYVRALADFVCARGGVPSTGVAATGGSVSARIARLIGEPSRPHRKRQSSFAVPAILTLIAVAAIVHAQTAERPKFEVATIREDAHFIEGKFGGMGSPSPGTYRARDESLRWLIRTAYNVNSFNIFGGPPWLDTAGFDIDAKAPVVPGETKRQEVARMNVMVQSLLEERLKLKVHVEKRDMPVFILTISKKGLKMKHAPCDPREGQPDCGRQFAEARKTWSQPVSGAWGTMADFIVGLATTTNGHRAIVDKTGLTGTWDTHMQWRTPAPLVIAGMPQGPPVTNNNPPTDPEGPSIFTAIEDQLGLHLESGRAPIDVLVIDSAEKPDPDQN